MNLNGEVAVWGEKNLLSVFRVPLMGLVFQVVFLLMKEGSLQFRVAEPLTLENSQPQERILSLSVAMVGLVSLGRRIQDGLRISRDRCLGLDATVKSFDKSIMDLIRLNDMGVYVFQR